MRERDTTLIVGPSTHLFLKCLLDTCAAPLGLGQVLRMEETLRQSAGEAEI